MYIREIIWLILWPVSIYVTYRVILWAIGYMEKRHPKAFKSPVSKQPK